MNKRLGSIEQFPPAGDYVYMDAASVGLSHSGGASAITDWQRALAEKGTVAFTEQDEMECLNNLNDAAASLFNADVSDLSGLGCDAAEGDQHRFDRDDPPEYRLSVVTCGATHRRGNPLGQGRRVVGYRCGPN